MNGFCSVVIWFVAFSLLLKQAAKQRKPELLDVLELHVSTSDAKDSKNKFRIFHQAASVVSGKVFSIFNSAQLILKFHCIQMTSIEHEHAIKTNLNCDVIIKKLFSAGFKECHR